MVDQIRGWRRASLLLAAMMCSLLGLDLAPAHAQVDPAAETPTQSDPEQEAQAGRDAGEEQSNRPVMPGIAGEGAPAGLPAEVGGPSRFVTYRVFATQYVPHTPGAVEVAVPDRCVKFASLGNVTALNAANCGPGYALDLDYRVALTLDNGRSATIPVEEVGPWNLDDNWWNPTSGTPRPRRLFRDLPTGKPEAQAAFYDDYNLRTNCTDLQHNPTARSDGADQFGRCVLNPAGIDLSVAAAAQLGLGNLENAWLTVTFLWEPANSTYNPVTPARILDTRDGTGSAAAPLGPGETIDVAAAGVGGVPASDVLAVVVNVTAVDMVGPETFLTVYPTGSARPLASSLNLTEGRVVPNLVVARVGAEGRFSIYNHQGQVGVIADVQGWYFASGATGVRFSPVAPARVLDTRDGTGRGGAVGQVAGGSAIELTVAGAGGVPSTNVDAVVLNVTAANLQGPDTYVTVWPSGVDRPLASNLQATTGPAVPILVTVRVNQGRVLLYNHAGSVDLVADVQGWYGPGAATTYVSTAPVRGLDTRDGTGGPLGKVGPNGTVDFPVAGVNGAPAAVRAVVVNLTVTDHSGPESYLRAYPSGGVGPVTSNLNFVAGQTRANLVVVPVGANGRVALYNHAGDVHMVADVQGWFT